MNLQRALWLANIALEIAVLAFILYRGANRSYRTFFVYRIVGTLQSLILLALDGHDEAYLWTYWILEVSCLVMLGAVLQDLFERILPPSSSYRSWGTLMFYAVCFVAIATAIFSVPAKAGSGIGPVNSIGLRAEEGMIIIHAILVMFLVFYSLTTKPLWNNWSLGIFVGICFLVATELLAIHRYLHFGADYFLLYSWVKPLSYTAAFVAWIWGFSLAPASAPPGPELERIKTALRQIESR